MATDPYLLHEADDDLFFREDWEKAELMRLSIWLLKQGAGIGLQRGRQKNPASTEEKIPM